MLEYRYPAREATETTPSSSVRAAVDAGDRLFTRSKMSGLL
jgi:hypothetical protein